MKRREFFKKLLGLGAAAFAAPVAAKALAGFDQAIGPEWWVDTPATFPKVLVISKFANPAALNGWDVFDDKIKIYRGCSIPGAVVVDQDGQSLYPGMEFQGASLSLTQEYE